MNIIAFFTDAGTPKTGLTPTIRIRKVSDYSLVITDEAMAEVGDGFYNYDFTIFDKTKDYVIRMDGSATLSATDRYKYCGNSELWTTMNSILTRVVSSAPAIAGIPIQTFTPEEKKKLFLFIEGTHKLIYEVKKDQSLLSNVSSTLSKLEADFNNIKSALSKIPLKFEEKIPRDISRSSRLADDSLNRLSKAVRTFEDRLLEISVAFQEYSLVCRNRPELEELIETLHSDLKSIRGLLMLGQISKRV